MLEGKKILIGITGSIAAYKIPFLIRLLKKQGAEVQVLMSPFAADFVTPLTLSTLSEKPVLMNFFDKGDGSWTSHVDLGMWADVFLIAPVTANTMAKMASGIADNLLLTTILSARCPVFFAPAMDLDMYKHPSTAANIKKLQSFGYKLIEPVEGALASGLMGFGRLEEPEFIYNVLQKALTGTQAFKDKKVLITAGPTFEPIDPVRFVGNYSSGKMGKELASAMAEQGAEVFLVLGPSAEQVVHPKIRLFRVHTAAEMHAQCMALYDESEVVIMAAAVADFTPAHPVGRKIKKEQGLSSIDLKPTIDILADMGGKKKQNQLLVGFALETNQATENALHKLKSKNLDMIVMNSLADEGAGFGGETNRITLFTRDGQQVAFPLKSKKEVARDICVAIEQFINTPTV